MQPKEANCPSCGAGLPARNPAIVMIVCEHCGNAVYWDEDAIANAGKQAQLSEGFTRLYTGATGSIGKHRFRVQGRVRYSFGHGFWDEWYVVLDNDTTAWLSEDNHELALETEVQDVDVPPFEQFRPGMTFSVGDVQFVAEEVGEAECIGVEGELPRRIATGEKYPYVDAGSLDGAHTLGIEYDDTPPTVFRGRWLAWNDVTLDDEGDDW